MGLSLKESFNYYFWTGPASKWTFFKKESPTKKLKYEN